MRIKSFQKKILDFYKEHKRDFPWRPPSLKPDKQNRLDPYKILISEVMLQQTQTYRVIPKYNEWLVQFPDFQSLAIAQFPKVLKYWSGLGYNRRALYLQKTAQRVMHEFDGNLPTDPKILETFPGIGRNTAGSIYVFSSNKPHVFIETNIRRVFIHEFFSKTQSDHRLWSTPVVGSLLTVDGISDKQLLPLIEEALDKTDPRNWFYALMDYGSYLAKQFPNPNQKSRHYTRQSKFEGSFRQIRGQILKLLLEKEKLSKEELLDRVEKKELIDKAIAQLQQEGFITTDGTVFRVRR